MATLEERHRTAKLLLANIDRYDRARLKSRETVARISPHCLFIPLFVEKEIEFINAYDDVEQAANLILESTILADTDQIYTDMITGASKITIKADYIMNYLHSLIDHWMEQPTDQL